jgi:hypothetical protein
MASLLIIPGQPRAAKAKHMDILMTCLYLDLKLQILTCIIHAMNDLARKRTIERPGDGKSQRH